MPCGTWYFFVIMDYDLHPDRKEIWQEFDNEGGFDFNSEDLNLLKSPFSVFTSLRDKTRLAIAAMCGYGSDSELRKERFQQIIESIRQEVPGFSGISLGVEIEEEFFDSNWNKIAAENIEFGCSLADLHLTMVNGKPANRFGKLYPEYGIVDDNGKLFLAFMEKLKSEGFGLKDFLFNKKYVVVFQRYGQQWKDFLNSGFFRTERIKSIIDWSTFREDDEKDD